VSQDLEIPMVNMVIDGVAIKAPQGSMIIEAADNTEGVVIPRFCYHKKLSIAANCRMCLVELEGGRKPMPACATPVSEGMKVFTKSQKTMEYQKSIMEFLLINHPLDCPICDQGGECELQDVAMGYGKDLSKYTLGKRSVPEKDIGPLVSTDLTRCIHCTRCVRFGQEIAGLQDLGMLGRGEHSEISGFLEGSMSTELSGNIIDLCPVGALTSKPFKYSARAWELQQQPGISFHDGVGSHLYGHVRRGELMRVVPRENENLNEVWLSDRDRYSYEGLKINRAEFAQIKNKDTGLLENKDWAEVLDVLVNQTHELCQKSPLGPKTIAALISPNSTLEEGYLLQKLLRQIGSNNLDFRLRQQDFRADSQADLVHGFGLDHSICDIENFDTTLLIGSNVRYEQPIIHHRIRNAVRDDGAVVMSINPERFNFRFRHHDSWIVNQDEMPGVLAQVVKAAIELNKNRCELGQKSGQDLNFENLESVLSAVEVTDHAHKMAENLIKAKSPVIFLGELAIGHPQYSLLLGMTKVLTDLVGAKGGVLSSGANSRGLAQVGCLPNRRPGYQWIVSGSSATSSGFNLKELMTGEIKPSVIILFNTDPVLDSFYGEQAREVLKRADLVIAITPYLTESLKDLADIVLPLAATPETSGTFVNFSGLSQSFAALSSAPGEARPGWKILRVLGNFFKQEGFDYISSEEVLGEIKSINLHKESVNSNFNFNDLAPLPISRNLDKNPDINNLSRMAPVPIYGADMMVRHAEALSQTMQMQDLDKIKISEKLAQDLNLKPGDWVRVSSGRHQAELEIKIEPVLADHTIEIYQARTKTAALGGCSEGFSLEKINKSMNKNNGENI